MIIKYAADIRKSAIESSIRKIINQVYKLLPMREEGVDWIKPLETLIVELAGMDNLLIGQHETLFRLLCKLEGLSILTQEEDFLLYRRTIFDCLSILDTLLKDVRAE